ncbi:MAG: hypothetical protein FWD25_09485 [Clostridia bacterium]|nr:hypothetical protein [Clostridia bacterium]
MKEHLSGIWDKVREKEALAVAGQALCAQPTGFIWTPKLWLSATCGLIITLAPIAGAAL